MTTNELRELDAWIAENVMGWRNIRMSRGCPFSEDDEGQSRYNEMCGSPKGEAITFNEELPHYTTDPAAAMEVLKKCAEKSTPAINHMEKKGYYIFNVSNWSQESTQDTLEIAICLFAKKLFAK